MALTLKFLQEQIEQLRKEIECLKNVQGETQHKRLSADLTIGESFELAEINWKIIDITAEGYMCLADSIGNMEFDSGKNDWRTSDLRKYLNEEFLEKIESEIGAGNLIEFERNLLSLDGQTEYGTCDDKVSLLTVDEYRKYRNVIPNSDNWWWMITPWSTSCNGFNNSVAVVAPAGDFNYGYCDDGSGVRPFCIFSSEIFESEDE